jgi:hypothetical protein
MNQKTATAIEEKIIVVVRQLPQSQKAEVLNFAEQLNRKTKLAEATAKKQSKSKLSLPEAIAKLVEEGKLEFSDCSDFGIDRSKMKATMSFEELRNALSKISVPIEEYIREGRDRRERL